MSLRDQQNKLDSLFSQLKDVFSAEYERGNRDAVARIVGVAQKGSTADKGLQAKKGSTATVKKARAPRGAARQLVEKALKDEPRTIKEICNFAKTDVEKLVSYQTARLELERGKKEKRYKNNKGKWSLVA